MSNLYHEDIYKFDEPVKSYWETTSDTNNKYNKLEKNIQTNIVVIGGGYTGISCALSLAKNFNEDVVLVEAGHIGWGSSARNAGFCCIYPAKMSVATMFKKFGKEETKKFFKNTIEGSNFTKNLIDEYKINCDLTGDSNYEVAPHPSYFESIKEEALIYKKEFGIETKVYSKEEFISNSEIKNKLTKSISLDLLKKVIHARIDEILNLSLKNINFSSLINDKNKCILVFTGEGSKILDKNSIYLENKFNFFKEMNFFEESVSTICQSGYNFNKKNYLYEVNIVSKKPKKNGFFEKLFHFFN